jgi:hypothetical protein
MALQIGENLERVRLLIQNGTISGLDFAKDAKKAIFAGKGSTVWEDFMKKFVPAGSRELERMCGRDAAFNNTLWGELCLVYVIGDSTCTSETTMRGGTKRSMLLVDEIRASSIPPLPPRRMLELLDAEGPNLTNLDAEVRAAEASRESDADTARSGDLSNTDSSDTDTSNDKS